MKTPIWRLATPADLEAILEIIAEARAFLAAQNSGQWQDGHPRPEAIAQDIENHRYYVIEANGIIIGGLAGWIADMIMKTDNGLLMNIIIGIVGAVVGNFLLYVIFGATIGGIVGQLIVAVLGAVILIWLWRLITGRRTTA